MKGGMEGGGCFRTGLHYPGIAHLIRVSVQGLAREWSAEEGLQGVRWACIDTETTGREVGSDRVVELGIAFFERGQFVGEKGWLINPERPIPADATAVHGISDEDVAGSPTFAEILPEVLECLRGAMPLAYNAEFDKGFLLAEFERSQADGSEVNGSQVNGSQVNGSQVNGSQVGGAQADPEPRPPTFQPDVTWLDPLTWAREIHKEEKSRALGDVCERLGIALENAHRATHDAKAAGHVLSVFLRDPRVPQTYGAFIREQRRLERLFEFQRVRWRS